MQDNSYAILAALGHHPSHVDQELHRLATYLGLSLHTQEVDSPYSFTFLKSCLRVDHHWIGLSNPCAGICFALVHSKLKTKT